MAQDSVSENSNGKVYKDFLKKYAMILGIFCVLSGILIYLIFTAKTPWKNNLRVSIEKVLDENDPNNWTLGNYCKINNTLGMSAICYEGRNRKNGEVYKIVMIRTATFYGPIPAVFTVSEDDEVEFIGYSAVHGRIANQLNNNKKNRRICYWKKQILEMFK